MLRVRRGPDGPEVLSDALEFVTRVARASGVHVVVLVLDEFQSVMEASEAAIGRLRSHAQSQDAVSYVLSGSRAGVLVGLTKRKNPFWRQLTEFPVGPIDLDAALRDVQRLTGMRFTPPARRLIADTVAPSTQRLVELLDILHRRYESSGVESVRDALEVLVGRHADAFGRVFGTLTPYQRRVLVALAVHRPEHPTGASFVQANGLRAASHVQKALAALRREEILTDDHRFEDPLFRLFVVRGAGGRT